MASSKTAELAHECKRLSEGCLYTSTSLFIWLRVLRTTKVVLTGLGLVLGGIAGWNVLSGSERWKIAIAFCALIAGLIPTLLSGLKIEEHIEQCKRLAGEFKNLQDRFRQAALVDSQKGFDALEQAFSKARDRLEAARIESVTPPEPIFWLAQRKVKSMDYKFDVDIALEAAAQDAASDRKS